jgi:acetyl-CoA C-acetyltransferase
MKEIAVIGIGITKFGELWEKSLRDIAVESAMNCLEDAGTDRINSINIGCMSSGLFIGQEHLATLNLLVLPEVLLFVTPAWKLPREFLIMH